MSMLIPAVRHDHFVFLSQCFFSAVLLQRFHCLSA